MERIVIGYFMTQNKIVSEMYIPSIVVSYIVTLVGYTFMFFIVQNAFRNSEQIDRVLKSIRICVVIIMIYALLQFFLGIDTIQIPGITVNYTDCMKNPHSWWLYKTNQIGNGNSKIVSTYQNGNTFGINLLLLFPIIYNLKWNKLINKYAAFILLLISILICGSRTALFGCIFYLFILTIKSFKKKQIYVKKLIFLPIFIFLVTFTIIKYRNLANVYIQRVVNAFDWNFIVSASGRTSALMKFFNWLVRDNHILSIIFGAMGTTHDGRSGEVLPATLFILGGIIGLFFFYYPIFTILYRLTKCTSYMAKGLIDSIIVYLFVSIVEGSFWANPTAILVWVILGISYKLTLLDFSENRNIV